MLFNAWLDSSTHKTVIEDPDWNWVGIAYEMINGSFVAVVDFSTGNLGSSKIIMENNSIIFSANYIVKPVLSSKRFITEIYNNRRVFKIIMPKEDNNKILFIGTEYKKITDRIEIFLK